MQQSNHVAKDGAFAQNYSGDVVFGLCVSIILFALSSYFFGYEYRPDETKALTLFLAFFGSNTTRDEFFVRIILYLFNISLTFVLFSIKWIDRRTLVLALIWPLTVFLFSKIYWEFYVFPFALLRIDRDKWFDLIVIAILSSMYLLFREGNIILMIAFRLVIFTQKIGYGYLSPIAFSLAGILGGIAVEQGTFASAPLVGQQISRFSWTREVANPDYSIIESITVFFSSFHFFTQHYLEWWIDFLFSSLVLAYVVFICMRRGMPERFLLSALAIAAVFIGFTELTHAFQNARYYFFFIPVLASLISSRDIVPLSIIGVLHVVLKGVEVA